MQIVLLKVVCWETIVQKCKWLPIRDHKFFFFKNENTFTVNERQRKIFFIYWWFWMWIDMQMFFLNVPYALMKVVLVLMSILTIMKQIWTQMNGYFLEMNSKRCIAKQPMKIFEIQRQPDWCPERYWPTEALLLVLKRVILEKAMFGVTSPTTHSCSPF